MTEEAVKTFLDGREVCQKNEAGRNEYQRRITLMWERQKKCCCLCWRPLRRNEATFEHEAGRGMGGGHRDDRIVLPDGTWINGAAHGHCNSEKGSQRGSYNRWEQSLTNSVSEKKLSLSIAKLTDWSPSESFNSARENGASISHGRIAKWLSKWRAGRTSGAAATQREKDSSRTPQSTTGLLVRDGSCSAFQPAW